MLITYIFYNICIIYFFVYLLKLIDILDFKKNNSYKRLIDIYNVNVNVDNIYNKTRYKKKLVNKDIDVIIVGSGISGLTVGGLLAKAGKKILILEQHDIAGGSLHSFNLKGIEHETGLHYIGNIEKRKDILNLITEEDIEWCELGKDDNIYDEIFIGDNHYKFEKGEINLKKYLKKLFPLEEDGIDKYFNLVKKVADRNLYFKLKSFPYEFISNYIKYLDPIYYKYCLKTTYDTISEIVKDEELIAVLCGQCGDYGITPKKSNFYTHAIIVDHYLNGGYFPKGGTNVISNGIIKFIKNRGGEVLVGKKVEELIIENNVCKGVIMENSDIIYSKMVISSIGIRNTFKHLVVNRNEDKYLKSIINKYNKLKIDSSVYHMYCFIKLKGDPDELNLRSSNMWIYDNKDYDTLYEKYFNDPLTEPMPLFIAFSCKKDTEWTKKYEGYSNCVILAPISKDTFDEFKDTKINNRGIHYEFLKDVLGDRMIKEGLLKKFPELEDKIEDINIGSPLTTKHYLNSYYGESYGLDMSSERLLNGGKLRPKTDIKNLYLTGQDICSIGITGGMMSGVLTANVVMGYDNLIDIYYNNTIINDLNRIDSKR